MINIWEHFDGKIVFFAKTDTNLLTHKAEDGLAEADDPEDEADEEDEEEEDTATLGDEELKNTNNASATVYTEERKMLSQKAQMSCFSWKYISAPWVGGWWWGRVGKASQGRSFRRRVEGGGLTK